MKINEFLFLRLGLSESLITITFMAYSFEHLHRFIMYLPLHIEIYGYNLLKFCLNYSIRRLNLVILFISLTYSDKT